MDQIELSKTDSKYYNMILSQIADLQAFIDKNIVDGKTMTASMIYQKFPGAKGLTEEDFIRGFRIALREEKITGIEGAQRAGYKRIGSTIAKAAKPLAPYMERLQKFVSDHIKGPVRMTSAVIYEKFVQEYGCSLTEEVFVSEFRACVRDNTITGLEGVKRAGYKAATKPFSKPVDSETDEEEIDVSEGGPGLITIDDTHRIISADSRNWSYQIRKDSGIWSTEAYFSNHAVMIQGLARKLLDKQLRAMESFNIKELSQKIEQAENNIVELLKKAISTPSKPSEIELEQAEE